jgi:hypothetical protein
MGEQGLYLLRPTKNQIVSSFSQGTSEPTFKSAKSRSKIVLSGFFGRGNVGDEALSSSVSNSEVLLTVIGIGIRMIVVK